MIRWREAATHMPRFMRPSFATLGCVVPVACNLYCSSGTGSGVRTGQQIPFDQDAASF